MKPSAILLISCPDRKGLVATVSDYIYKHGGNILHTDEHTDADAHWFLMRVEFDPTEFDVALADVPKSFGPIAKLFNMDWRLADSATRPRMAIMVSKYDHCLVDLLYRHKIGELRCEIPLILSNHPDNQPIADFYGIPFFHIPVPKDGKSDAEKKQRELIAENRIDFIVLARYMQVLSKDFCGRMPGRVINIHHSFLPSFKGAKPYHQAHERGVKLIGATAHYVTDDLDEGPIIEQEVERVSHALSADEYVGVGRDIESRVLARAVKWHAEHRILLNGRRTVVFV